MKIQFTSKKDHARTFGQIASSGIFYRRGVDIGTIQPFKREWQLLRDGDNKTLHQDGNTPIPDKSASSTAQVFLEKVLCRYGKCTGVITDGGMEFAEDFDDLLQKNFIDLRKTAPNHPLADGLAERAVQTIKRSLRKFFEMNATPKLWDKSTPLIMLGYNCSTQASTKMSPYYMLYARYPVVPPAHVQKFSKPIGLNDVKAAACARES